MKQISIRWIGTIRATIREWDIQTRRTGSFAARYHLCGYYRRRARKSTWRRTKGTLNALVTSTPPRPTCVHPSLFSFPERILYPKHWMEEKCRREERRKFTDFAKYCEYSNQYDRDINFSLRRNSNTYISIYSFIWNQTRLLRQNYIVFLQYII